MAGVLDKVTERFTRLFTRNAKKSTENPEGPTQDSADRTWREFEKESKEGEGELRKSAREEIIDRILSAFKVKWFKAQLAKFINWAVETVEKGLRWLIKPRSAGKKAMLTAGALAIVVSGSMRFYLAEPRPDAAPPPSPSPDSTTTLTVNGIEIPSPPPKPTDVPQDLAMSDSDMYKAFDQLGIPTLEQMGRARVELDVSDPPPLPPVITAAYAEPVAISAQRGTETYTAPSTVGQAYEALPAEARDRFVQEVENSSYDDHHIELRNNFTVTSPIGSLTISTN